MGITNYIKIWLLLAIVQFLLASGCNKDSSTPCVFGGYSFNATAEWNPQKENYSVGDTLFIFSSISKLLQDQINTSLMIDYSNSIGIGGDMGVGYLDSINHRVIPAKDSFDFVSITGSFLPRTINTNQGINLTYFESSNNYIFHGGIVCKKRGIYGISMNNLLSRGIKGKNCTNAGFNIVITNSNKNLSIWENALQITLDQFSAGKNYCFRVQ